MKKEINLKTLESNIGKGFESEYITDNGNVNLHVSAFDYQQPILTFLGGIGIGKGPNYLSERSQFIEDVYNGTKVLVNEEQKQYARKFLDNWNNLIQETKQGNSEPTSTPFGDIELEYDKERILSEDHWEKFNKWVNAVCSIAKHDTKKTIEKMLS